MLYPWDKNVHEEAIDVEFLKNTMQCLLAEENSTSVKRGGVKKIIITGELKGVR